MATYKVLYWQEIPSQINAEDDDGEVAAFDAIEIRGADRSDWR